MQTVTRPYENTRKPVSRGGRYPWSVTLRQGCLIETRTFTDRAEADALFAKATRAQFKEV